MTFIIEHILAISFGFVALWVLLLIVFLTCRRAYRKRLPTLDYEAESTTSLDYSTDPIIQHIIAIKKGQSND